jgi:hypothetical protein
MIPKLFLAQTSLVKREIVTLHAYTLDDVFEGYGPKNSMMFVDHMGSGRFNSNFSYSSSSSVTDFVR